MQSEEFMKNVRARSGLHSNEEAKQAIEAVFETLRDRILHDTGDNLRAQLPHEMQHLWEAGLVEHVTHKVVGPTRMDLQSFTGRVADRLGTADFEKAKAAMCAVFTTIRQSVTPGMQEEVERELPEDIKQFWMSCQPPEMPKEAPEAHAHAGTQQQEQEVVQTGPPFEMEAPVASESGAWVGSGACEVCGQTAEVEEIEIVELHTEAGHHRHEGGMGGQPIETEGQMVGEREEHNPAEDRVDVLPGGSAHNPVEGPGNPIHYRSDPQLEQEIRELLDSSEELAAEKIDVLVQAGNVTLRGNVKSPEERDKAGHIAAKALGVGEILNELNVEKPDVGENI